MKKLFIIPTLFLAGCMLKQPDLYKPADLSAREATLQEMECERYAMQQVQMMGLQNNPFNQLSIQPRVTECLRRLGWR